MRASIPNSFGEFLKIKSITLRWVRTLRVPINTLGRGSINQRFKCPRIAGGTSLQMRTVTGIAGSTIYSFKLPSAVGVGDRAGRRRDLHQGLRRVSSNPPACGGAFGFPQPGGRIQIDGRPAVLGGSEGVERRAFEDGHLSGVKAETRKSEKLREEERWKLELFQHFSNYFKNGLRMRRWPIRRSCWRSSE